MNTSWRLRPAIDRLEGRLLPSSGQLDTSFSGDGKVTLDPGITSDARDVAIQADGKVVVVGRASSNGNDFVVARFNVDGSPDTSFGKNGLGFVRTHVGGTTHTESAASVAIDSDGKIIVAGWTSEQTVEQFNVLFAVARYLPDGTLDTTFNGDGTKGIDFTEFPDSPVDSQGFAVALPGDGKILLAGYYMPDGFAGDFMLMRLNNDGSLDSSFDGDGKTSAAFGNDDRALSMSVNHNGTSATNPDFESIVLAGFTSPQDSPLRSIAVAKFSPDGKLVKSFGLDGKVMISLPALGLEADSVFIQPDNKILIAGKEFGQSRPGGSDFFVARLNADGTSDTSFGGNGTGFVETDFGGGTDAATAIQSNAAGDGILVAGVSGRKFAIAQYTNTGVLDSRFGSGGEVTTDFGDTFGGGSVVGMARQGKRFVVAGGEHLKTARYLDAGANLVSVGSFDLSASETGPDPASLIVARSENLGVPTRVFFTIGGTAKRPGSGVTSFGTDYNLTNVGGLTNPVQFVDIPAGQSFTIVTLTPISDARAEPTETAVFTIAPDRGYDIASPNSATIEITDFTPSSVGTFRVAAEPNVRVGEVSPVAVTWTVPSGSWRQLKTIDLLLRDLPDNVFALLRWDEATSTFRLFNRATGRFGPPAQVGGPGVLSNRQLDVVMNQSSVSAAGPTSPVVTVTFALRFKNAATGRAFGVDVAAQNDSGLRARFARGALIRVSHLHRVATRAFARAPR